MMSSFNFIPSVSPMWKYLVKLFVSKAFQNHRSRWVLPWATTSWKYITLGQVVNYTGWSLQDNTEFSMYYSPNPKKGTICTSQSNSAFLHCSPLDIDILSSFSCWEKRSGMHCNSSKTSLVRFSPIIWAFLCSWWRAKGKDFL